MADAEDMQLLLEEHAELRRLLTGITAGIARAGELAASVRQRLDRAAQRRADADDASSGSVEFVGMPSQYALPLQLLMEPSGAKVTVELPIEATVFELKAAVHRAGGPLPGFQELVVSGRPLPRDSTTPLSRTGLISPGAVVAVRESGPRQCLQFGYAHGTMLLDGGEVRCWGDPMCWEPMPDGGAHDHYTAFAVDDTHALRTVHRGRRGGV
eukprot:TRINITY_DN5792_c0_g1_i2.p1 TRINITY_DN5792_c0_g1~~TRINITY_DN5792_c0_g1_i2.p1  ORF type:complete len:228 (+),score=70.73 TRINITY_DN5792_c0_g1_i2:49-684(+)